MTEAERDRRILRLFAEGRSPEAIAIHFDLNAMAVTGIVRRAVAAAVNGPRPAVAAAVPDAGGAAPTIDRLGELLAGAAASSSPRTRREGQRLEVAAAALAGVLAEEQAAAERAEREAAERKAAQERLDQARAEFEAAQAAVAQVTGKRAGKGRAAAPRGSGGPDPKTVRAWAAANGVPCKASGRVPQVVLDAYEAAHRSEAA